ncbi:ABC transporter permease [Rhizobium sp. IBUN]|uniref:ABC transporter permease n=1 Tax=Rhizobium sp. IBUN TaxID=1042326 RepID=UPI0005691691|nr:ABC transporter permease [Rhizobium sp. IBUN]
MTTKSRLASWLIQYNTLLMLIILIVVSASLSDVFLSPQNLWNLARQLVPLALVSIGMLLVILTGGIDLSVGALAAIGAMIMSMLLPYLPDGGAIGLFVGVLIAMVGGAALGAVTGSLVAAFSMAPFIASLAMMTVARGIAFMMSNGQPVRFPSGSVTGDLLRSFGSSALPGIGMPWPVLLAFAVISTFVVIMSQTKFGRLVTATGSNEVAVRLAGLAVGRYKLMVYVIAGALAALAGIVATSRTAVGTANTGIGLELDAIAACVIGGALLSGGKGSVINTIVGVLILGLIGNIMNLLSVPAYPQQIIKGVIIVFAVLLQNINGELKRT